MINRTNVSTCTQAMTFNIPYCLAEKILSQTRVKHYFGGREKRVSYSDDEYNLMLIGASLAYNNQTLMGTKLPTNHPKAIEIGNFLVNLGVMIQYHPDHGMIIVDQDYKLKEAK